VTPHPYQKAGAQWLAEGEGHKYLADDMGLGKTCQAILAAETVGGSVLVVCPASLRRNWRAEFLQWGVIGGRLIVVEQKTDLKGVADVVVVSYEGAVNLARYLTARKFDVVIFDEAHYLKGAPAKRGGSKGHKLPARVAKALGGRLQGGGYCQHARHVWWLSGTPTPNYCDELYNFARAAGLWDKNREAYRTRFLERRPNGFGFSTIGNRNKGELRNLLEGNFMRRTKTEVLSELPPLTYGTLEIVPDIDGVDMPATDIIRATDAEIAAQELARLSDDFIENLTGARFSTAEMRRLHGLAKAGPLADRLNEQLRDSDQAVVIFAHHRDVIAILDEHLRGHGVVTVTGETSPRKRNEAVQAFQREDGPRVFIGNISAAGTGLTLTRASWLVFCEFSYVPSDMLQAAMRIHRQGQRNACLVQLAHGGGIDGRIAQLLVQKMRAADAFYNENTALKGHL
jgi:SWI/SNF-related matrix-associated actin-dependent regulator 1 of chromatin subfamily A